MDADESSKEIESRFRRLSPSLISQASQCLHFYFLELYGDHSLKTTASAGQILSRERGLEFERQVVVTLKGVEEPSWDQKDLKNGYLSTVKLMEKGAPWIHGGVLMNLQLVGIPDLLKKVSGRSRFGIYSYIPVEIKAHKQVQKKDILQVVAYSIMLGELIGEPCTNGGVWLNTNEIEELEIADHLPVFELVKTKMEQISSKQLETEPIWCSACSLCQWLGFCKDTWNKKGSISLLPGGGKSSTQKLQAIGIKTITALTQSDPQQIAAMANMSEKSADKLWRHAQARVQGKPIVIKKPKFSENVPIVFYDVETYGNTVFLHGLIRLFEGKREEKFFFADSLENAEKAWHEFLEFIAHDKGPVIYCWTFFEQARARECLERFGGNEKAYKVLMTGLTDQCKWTSTHFAFPTRSYSIKEVAPALGFHWQAKDAGGMNCEAWYGEWLKTKDESLKKKILAYNRDDILAMEVIYQQLKCLCESLCA